LAKFFFVHIQGKDWALMFIFFICFYADLKLPLFEVCGSIFKLALIITIPTF